MNTVSRVIYIYQLLLGDPQITTCHSFGYNKRWSITSSSTVLRHGRLGCVHPLHLLPAPHILCLPTRVPCMHTSTAADCRRLRMLCVLPNLWSQVCDHMLSLSEQPLPLSRHSAPVQFNRRSARAYDGCRCGKGIPQLRNGTPVVANEESLHKGTTPALDDYGSPTMGSPIFS